MELDKDFRPVKLDFDALYAEAEAAGREGVCPMCEFDGDTTPHMLCWCGVCFKYHHDDYSHEPMDEFDPSDPFPWIDSELFRQALDSRLAKAAALARLRR